MDPINWNLNKVFRLVRQEADAHLIMEETGIKQGPLQTIVAMLNQRDKKFYMVRGLFNKDL